MKYKAIGLHFRKLHNVLLQQNVIITCENFNRIHPCFKQWIDRQTYRGKHIVCIVKTFFTDINLSSPLFSIQVRCWHSMAWAFWQDLMSFKTTSCSSNCFGTNSVAGDAFVIPTTLQTCCVGYTFYVICRKLCNLNDFVSYKSLFYAWK